ncbi:MAG: PASTA domain-containing protein [Ruminococcaceae bacterium]|nr:PASTA domain-containing protein [Oscillospiraceae bacterium]
MFCTKCGAQSTDGAKFCLNCGAPFAPQQSSQNAEVSAQSAVPINTAPQPAVQKKKGGAVKIILIILIAIVIFVAGGLAAWFFLGGDDTTDDQNTSKSDRADDEDKDDDDESKETTIDDSSSVSIDIPFAEQFDPSAPSAVPTDTTASQIIADASGEIEMPNLIGLSWDEAKDKYSSYLNLIVQQEWSEYAKDEIFEQEFPEGRKIKVGTDVIVKVSKGIKQIEVPDLTNSTLEAAERQLKKDGFKVTKTYAESEDVAENCIIRTEPPAHETAPQGSYVTLVVSLGAPDTLMSVPKLTDMPIETALERCEEYYLIPEIEMVDSNAAEGTVLEQSIEPNKLVDKNTTIELKVSTGNSAEHIKKFSFTVPQSAKGEFEFKYYIDGLLDTERGTEIRDISVAANKEIPYEIKGRDGETKSLAIMVTSTATGKTGTYLVVEFTFNANENGDIKVKNEIKEKNTKIFDQLNS